MNMSLFIKTDNIIDNDELIRVIKENNSISQKIKNEIKELEKISLEKVNNQEDTDNFSFDITVDEDLEENDDFEYEYYYLPIKNISSDENNMRDIIIENLPLKSNSRYFKIINRIKLEIYREIHDLIIIKNEEDEPKYKDEIQSMIDLERKKLSIINEEYEKQAGEEIQKQNKVVFAKTPSGNIYALEDVKSIDSEYYLTILELYESIKNGSFKNVKRLISINNKVSSISEVKGNKVRILFDKVSSDTYVIIQIIIKKSDFDKGYKVSLENRVANYRSQKSFIKSNLNNKEYNEENENIENTLINTLSKNKVKGLTLDAGSNN